MTSSPHKIAWRTLSRGLTSGITTHRHVVIRDEATYFKLWAEHAADVPRVALPPEVDFSREMVLLIALGDRPTGGYVLQVIDMEVRKHTLRVLVSEDQPLPGTLQALQVTQPYQFVALPTMDARVNFRWVHPLGRPTGPRKARPGEDGGRR